MSRSQKRSKRATGKGGSGKAGSGKAGCLCVSAATTAEHLRTVEQIKERKQMIKAAKKFIKKRKRIFEKKRKFKFIKRRKNKFVKKRKYKFVKKMKDIGSRLQKYWIEIETKGRKSERIISYVVSVSKFPTVCPIGTHEEVASNIEVINKLLGIIKAHPFIHEIEEVAVMTAKKISGGLVIFVQKKSPKGSLRDLIYSLDKGDFANSWSEKHKGIPAFREDFQCDAIKYITQILKGMVYLRKIGFPFLGNIHLGNVFLTEGEDGKDRCTITGHENALFGYRTSIYHKICEIGYIKYIDVIMLGHMLYELATCQPLQDVFPTKEQRKAIADKPVRKLLKFIFETSDTKMKHTLDEILEKIIEKGWYTVTDDLAEEKDISVSDDIKELLGKIKL